MDRPEISYKNPNLILMSVIFALLAIIFNSQLLFGIIILASILFWNLNFWQTDKKNNSICLIIISFLVVTSDLGNEIRMAVNITGVVLLIYLFLNKNGFTFSIYPKFPRMLSGYLLLVIFSMVISSVFSINLYVGISETLRQVFFFIIVYLLFSFLQSERIVYYYLSAIIIAAIVLTVSIFFTIINSDILMYLLRIEGVVTDSGYFNNQAAAGGLFTVSIPILLSIIFSKRIIKTEFNKYLILITSAQIIGLLLTNSRAAISATLISTILILFLLRKRLLVKSIKYLVITGTSAIIFFPFLIDIISVYFRVGRVLENTRYYIWDMAYQMIISHPILGIGPGQFSAYMYNNLPVLIGTWEEKQLRWLYDVVGSGSGIAHNFLIQRFTELGILGLITGIFLPIMFLYTGIKLMKILKGKDTYPLIVGIVSSGIGLFYRSFFEATGIMSYGWITRDLPFWILFIILVYIYQQSKNYSSEKSIS